MTCLRGLCFLKAARCSVVLQRPAWSRNDQHALCEKEGGGSSRLFPRHGDGVCHDVGASMSLREAIFIVHSTHTTFASGVCSNAKASVC